MMAEKFELILIGGPTGAGKSDIALQIADKFKCPILNGDSLQLYRGLDIGTAKPSLMDRARVPHFLFDVAEPGEKWTAGEYCRQAHQVVANLQKQGIKRALLVGGSGFYIQALEKGMYDLPKIDEAVRASLDSELKANGLAGLYAELLRSDKSYAEKISNQDEYRILRGLEVIRGTGQTVTQVQSEFRSKESPWTWRKYGIQVERTELRYRVRVRTHKMLELGLVQEVEHFRAMGFANWEPLQSVGYHEVQQFLDKKIAKDALPVEIENATMRLAKKQMTWFRRDSAISWLAAEQAIAEIERQWTPESLD